MLSDVPAEFGCLVFVSEGECGRGRGIGGGAPWDRREDKSGEVWEGMRGDCEMGGGGGV